MGASLPPFFREKLAELQVWQWGGLLLAVLLGVAIGLLVAWLLRRIVEQVVRHTPVRWDDPLARAISPPAKLGCTLLSCYLLVRPLELPEGLISALSATVRGGTTIAVVWAIIRALHAVAIAVADETYMRDTMDPRRLAQARSMRTQIIVATRVASALVFIVGMALVALQFSVVRSFGVSLLASAGVAGVALGFAAQKSLGALLAGIQISLSQPIRIGDSVFLQGEYVTIEDISLTYVTVRLWDERRMIVPTPRFLEEPFQNWSRTHIGLIGTVFLRVDFTTPMEALRDEFLRLMDHEPLWDGRVKHFQVHEAHDDCVEIRLLVSGRDPPTLYDLRVSVREKMVTWLQQFEHGRHLPRNRLTVAEGSALKLAEGPSSNGHRVEIRPIR